MPGASILLAEDDLAFRDTVEDALADEGHRITTARNGAEALVALDRLPRPALILLDLHMPVMDGVSFLNALRLRPDRDEFEVVIMTARVDIEWFHQAEGVIRAMKKPFELSEIVEVTREFARRRPATSARGAAGGERARRP